MVERPEAIRWCVVHDAEITMLRVCWKRFFRSTSYPEACEVKEADTEPIMEMERIRIDEETPEGWDEILVGAEFKMLSRVVGYRRVLPIRDQDMARVLPIRDQDMAPREDWGRLGPGTVRGARESRMTVATTLSVEVYEEICDLAELRMERFGEDWRMALGVVLFNYGERYKVAYCIMGDWSGPKREMAQTDSGLPICPRCGSVATETAGDYRWALLSEQDLFPSAVLEVPASRPRSLLDEIFERIRSRRRSG